MEAKIKNEGGVFTMTLKTDFNQIIEKNFTEICKAIAVRGKVLNELYVHFEKNPDAFGTLVKIIRNASCTNEAAMKMHEETGLSVVASQYILNMELSSLALLSKEIIRRLQNNYKKQIACICATY